MDSIFTIQPNNTIKVDSTEFCCEIDPIIFKRKVTPFRKLRNIMNTIFSIDSDLALKEFVEKRYSQLSKIVATISGYKHNEDPQHKEQAKQELGMFLAYFDGEIKYERKLIKVSSSKSLIDDHYFVRSHFFRNMLKIAVERTKKIRATTVIIGEATISISDEKFSKKEVDDIKRDIVITNYPAILEYFFNKPTNSLEEFARTNGPALAKIARNIMVAHVKNICPEQIKSFNSYFKNMKKTKYDITNCSTMTQLIAAQRFNLFDKIFEKTGFVVGMIRGEEVSNEMKALLDNEVKVFLDKILTSKNEEKIKADA